MRTYTGSFSASFRIVVTDELVAAWRADAAAEGSKFLKEAHTKHPDDDEAFAEMVIKNGVRVASRLNLLDLIAVTPGMGGSVSPAKIEIAGIPVDAETPHIEPQVVEVERKAALSPALAAPYASTGAVLEPINADSEGA